MNQKAILVLVAIIVTVGILIVVSSIATPASAVRSIIVREKDTRSNPNSAEIRTSQEDDSGHHNPHP
jgi:hypothetical protein